jgi:fructosamine-3-kinase
MEKALLASNSAACIYLQTDDNGRRTLLKCSDDTELLACEAAMLGHLAPHLRVPEVLELTGDTLETEYIENDGQCSPQCEREAADALAALHRVGGERFGFERDTYIGPYRQSNAPMEEWIDFYRERRILDFAVKAFDEAQIDRAMLRRIEAVALRLESWLVPPARPVLLHGDVWSGNVLVHRGHLAAFIDPALFYGHPEMELAFIGMFDTFGETFYRRYETHHPIAPDFFDTRADLYRIFPYLVHVRAFGGGYLAGLDRILRRFAP